MAKKQTQNSNQQRTGCDQTKQTINKILFKHQYIQFYYDRKYLL